MDLVIRNLNPSIVKEIDEKAKNIGVSRQVYLKDLLENHTIMNDINDRELDYRERLDVNTDIIEKVAVQLEKNNEILSVLMEDDE